MNGIEQCSIKNFDDDNGNPAGGFVHGVGIDIVWQDGPLGRGADRIPANGAFVETIISAAKQRLEYYQSSKFKCDSNQDAITHLEIALSHLAARTKKRENAGTEGTHKV